MGLQSIVNINVDFYDKKYILINAKQLDKNSRFLSVTCYNHGDIYHINAGEHSAYIRYKKSDDYSVFNFCEINSSGKILVELTEQMLSSEGICYADLVIVNKGSANVDSETGEIVAIDNASILSTMTFCVDVSEAPILNYDVESSYEYDGLNDLLERAEADYEEVVLMAKSYAVGAAGGIRKNEDTDNAKYYSSLAYNSQSNASSSATSAHNYATNASASATSASSSATKAATAASNAESSATSASSSESKAKDYATTAQDSMNTAVDSAETASISASNAEYYYDKISEIIDGLNGAFLPMGTVEYSELAALVANGTAKTGFLYNISNDFVTDDTFKEGAGIEYSAGTNVYYTADDYWDCLTGTAVIGIKGNNETNYRKGNVNLTADNIGAIPTTDIATIDETKSYLGI